MNEPAVYLYFDIHTASLCGAQKSGTYFSFEQEVLKRTLRLTGRLIEVPPVFWTGS
jgi:hypothetical protein